MSKFQPLSPKAPIEASVDALGGAGAQSGAAGGDRCAVQHPVDLTHVRHLHKEVLSLEKSQRMAEFFSVLGDPNRLRIVSALALQELCVCDLAAIVKMSESAVSHQLRALRAMRLVGYRRQGRNVFYSLKDRHILNLYREVAEHLDEPEDA